MTAAAPPLPRSPAAAALTVAKTFDAASVSAGDPIGYTVTISNTGAGTAAGVNLTDRCPAERGHRRPWVTTRPPATRPASPGGARAARR